MSEKNPPLSQLGRPAAPAVSPEAAVLERVSNPHPDAAYVVRFTAPEFTSLCPITGQPDFAHLVIDYVPGDWLVESKSLKLFLISFRNHGAFHEDCTVYIGKRLLELLAPRWLQIGGYWYPRGGIPIDVFWQVGSVPDGVGYPTRASLPIAAGADARLGSCAEVQATGLLAIPGGRRVARGRGAATRSAVGRAVPGRAGADRAAVGRASRRADARRGSADAAKRARGAGASGGRQQEGSGVTRATVSADGDTITVRIPLRSESAAGESWW